jgi:hypothetical protein
VDVIALKPDMQTMSHGLLYASTSAPLYIHFLPYI